MFALYRSGITPPFMLAYWAVIYKFQQRKLKMGKEPNDSITDKSIPAEATEKDLLFHLMELVAKEDFTTNELQALIGSAKKIVSQRKSKPDLDTD